MFTRKLIRPRVLEVPLNSHWLRVFAYDLVKFSVKEKIYVESHMASVDGFDRGCRKK